MPKYKVIAPGFYESQKYAPDGKRNVVYTDKELKPCPSWLEKVKPETAAEKKKRLAAEKAQAESDAEKAEQDQVDKDSVTFIEAPKSTTTVENLG